MPAFSRPLVPGLLLLCGCAACAQAPSMLQQPAQPATVQLTGGKLTIEATNSSLRAILDDLEHRTGTHVEGLSSDQRIFGVYGPGNPQEVLASLLDDSGYNVVISGKQSDGAPREVELSAKTATAATPQSAGVTQAAQENDTDDDAPTNLFQAPAAQMPAPLPTPNPGANPNQVRTPQQMLEELQRMRQAQQGGSAPQ